MKYYLNVLAIFALMVFMVFSVQAQDRFDRSATIQEDTLDVGGFGYFVGGVDFDEDGRVEIYAANSDWYDVIGYDLVPRIYKYEKDDAGMWQMVWSTRLPLNFQNTWPALTSGDLDKDGKMEIIWGPCNNFGGGLQPNPERIVVYETPGDGSDNMGVENADGTWRPNAQWTITTGSQVDLRPFRWMVADVDDDQVDELVAGCRAGDGIQVYSVDDIPDAADSTETWTLEFSGVTGTFYDMTVMDNVIYGIQSNGNIYKVAYVTPGDSFQVKLLSAKAGLGSWNSAQVVDVDNNGTSEIIVASFGSSADNDIYLLQQSGDSLLASKIKDVPAAGYRSYGGAAGDIDDDGNLDFVFGTRQSTPNGLIYRCEYQGGTITDPNNWELTVIDQGISAAQQYDVFAISNLDGDGEDEVLYTGTPRGLTQTVPPQPLVILDLIPGNQAIITNVLDVPNDQGRQVWTIWQASEDDVPMDEVSGNNGTIPVAVFGPKDLAFPDVTINGMKLVPVRIDESAANIEQETISQYVVWRIDAGQYPVQVASTVPVQVPYYAAVVPTLGDGVDYQGTFVVSSHTPDPYVNWKSFPKTGMSKDNLIPTAPLNLQARVMDSNVELSWNESPDPDINYYSIRRGDQPGFNAADPATEVGTTTGLSFVDQNVQGTGYFYRVVAFDFNGNQGNLSDEISVPLGITNDGNNLPKSFALKQNYPNPFNPETWIAFDLPQAVNVQVVIYNALGQKVRTLVNESTPAGSYKVLWDGTNDSGLKVASGMYIYTIKAGSFVQSRKMTLMR